MLESSANLVPLWVTLLGFAAPLVALAGSAVAYVVKLFQDAESERRDHFFELMDYIDGKGTVAQKVAAVYELRQFPQHKEFVIRFCKAQENNVGGDAAESLRDEMRQTRRFFEEGK